jgi:hypothetical protein
MKTATLPPLRVSPELKKRIEGVLEEGETLSSFMLEAVTQKAQVRREQRAFLRKAMERSRQTERSGSFIPAEKVFDRLEEVLDRARQKAKRR